MSLAPTFAALRVFAWTFRLLVQCSPTFKVWFLKFGSSRRVSTRPKIRTTTPSTIILDREFYQWKIKLNNFVLLGSCSLLCVLVRFFEMKNRAGGRDIHPGAKF